MEGKPAAELLQETIANIRPTSAEVSAEVSKRLSLHGCREALGELGDFLAKSAEIAEEPPEKCIIICCADHGVAAMNTSAYPQATTLRMTANYLISRGGAANALANFAGAELLIVDMGIAAPTDNLPGLIRRRIANGTKNIAKEPAMTREQALQSLAAGIELATACASKGYRAILPGEMGIANTTSSAAIVAAVLNLPPSEATGRGTNISDERLAAKVSIVEQALATNRPDATDGLDVLAKLGGFELGAIAGLILGAAANGAFVILDGFNNAAAALIAQLLAPDVTDYLLPSQLSAERGHRAVLKHLGLKPYIDMRFRLGEACGSALAANFLDAAWAAYQKLADEDKDDGFFHEYMPPDITPVTDKTFDFYLKTMPSLDKESMAVCRDRLDNLTKPLHSLGFLEQIAIELAGITADERPPIQSDRALLVFTTGGLSPAQAKLTGAFAAQGKTEVTVAHIRGAAPPAAAFDFGRLQAESLCLGTPLIALALTESDEGAPFGTKAKLLRELLLDEEGGLRYPPDGFLRHLPKELQGEVGAFMGALIAAAHSSSLVILDDEATEIIARYAEALCPDLKPYILHIQPTLLKLHSKVPGGVIACLGLKIVDAALHVLNDMKTFAEASVPTGA